MTKEQLKEILPHREPMLLLDESTLQEDGTAIGTYTVKGDEWFLNGHFPGNPVVPGVILCEMIAQNSAVTMINYPMFKGATPYFTGLDKVKFRSMVKPGDTIRLVCKIDRFIRNIGFGQGSAYVGDMLACSAQFSFALIKPEN